MANGNTLWRDPHNEHYDSETTDGEGSVGQPADLGIPDGTSPVEPREITDPYNLNYYDHEITDGEGSSRGRDHSRLPAFTTNAAITNAMYPSRDTNEPDDSRLTPALKDPIDETVDITYKKAVA